VRNDQSYALVAGENLVGRDPRCAVWVDASGVSRRHALIDVDAGVATITDLESSNGTFVAGQRVQAPRRLSDGDVIELGAATLTFRSLAEGSRARTERIARR
jgi:pSer/pThr/pTyr-binding forkhead associated (FHA) protein